MRNTERKRKKRQGPACLFRRAARKERTEVGKVCLLKGPLHIEPWAGQGTAWVHPVR